MNITERDKRKFQEAYVLANKMNKNKIFRVSNILPSLKKEFNKEPVLINSNTIAVNGIKINIVNDCFIKEYTDFDVLCLGVNLRIKRKATVCSLSEKLPRGTKSGLLGLGWVFEFENILRLEGATLIQKNNLYYSYGLDGRLNYIKNKNKTGLDFYYIGDSPIIEKVISSCGKALYFKYKEDKVEQITDNIGRTVKYNYEGESLVSVTQVNNGVWKIDYDGNSGKINKIIDPNGNIDLGSNSWNITHDERKRIKAFQSSSANCSSFTVRYDRMNFIEELSCSEGGVKKFKYDSNGNLISEDMLNKGQNIFSYNEYGQMINKSLWDGSWEEWQWDNSGLLLKNLKSNGYERIWEHDSNGNLLETRTKTDKGVIAKEEYEYDSKGRLIKHTDANKNTIKYIYKYDESVLPETVEYPNGYRQERHYDEISRLIYEDDLGVSTRFVYNNMDKPVLIIYANELTEFRRYDYMGNLLEVILPKEYKDSKEKHRESRKHSFIYNEAQEVIGLVTPIRRKQIFKPEEETRKEELITYNFVGSILVKKTYSNYGKGLFNISSYTYDKNQNLIKEECRLGSTESCEGSNIHIITKFEYDNRNNISRICMNTGCERKFFYKGIDRLIKESVKINTDTWHNINYEYNKMGLVSTKIELMDFGDADIEGLGINLGEVSSIKIRTEFTYNENNMLIKIVLPTGSTMNIAYDDDGEIISTEENQFLSDIGNRFAGLKEKALALKRDNNCIYDKYGRILKHSFPDGTFELYEYDNADNVTGFTDRVGKKTAYKYNSINRLKEKTVDGVKTMFLYGLSGEVSIEKHE